MPELEARPDGNAEEAMPRNAREALLRAQEMPRNKTPLGDVFSAEKLSHNIGRQGVYDTPSNHRFEPISDLPGAFPQDIPLPPTPPREEEPPAASQGVDTPVMPARDQLQEVQQETQETHQETQQASQESDDEAEAQLQAELAPRDINSDVNEANIQNGTMLTRTPLP
ncbi:hypothetical protein N7522_000934 [Penicillium canescens]|nr:hypothetical protein N7522_000934 [Penicillium canescens]